MIHITTPQQLQDMQDDLTEDYILDNDLDMAGFDWTPVGIGPAGNGFHGSFDGQGFTISNLTYDDSIAGNNIAGIFGYIVGGTFQNVTFKDFVLTGNNSVAALCGFISTTDGSHPRAEVIIEEIHVINLIINVSDSSPSDFGGLIGFIAAVSAFPVTITNCDVSGVTINCVGNEAEVGGFIGATFPDVSTDILIDQCFASGVNIIGVVSPPAEIDFGGFIGYNQANISNCYAEGSVTNVASDCGGLVGYSYSCTILNCYANVNVSSDGGPTPEIGGFIGYADDLTSLINCYSVGLVSGGSGTYYGGFIGLMWSTVAFDNCAWWTGSTTNAIGGNQGDSNNPVPLLVTNGWGTDEDDNTAFYFKTHPVYAQGSVDNEVEDDSGNLVHDDSGHIVIGA